MSDSSAVHESAVARIWRRIRWSVRGLWPNRDVVREVQGVRMHLPWSHRLPDYAKIAPAYGQNLIDLAVLLNDGKKPLTMLDVGANVGDSTLQVLHATDARVLCVEADAYFVSYLERNAGDDARVTIEASLLSSEEADVAMAPVRRGGTTRFKPGDSDNTQPPLTIAALRSRHADFDELRLAKSDTDGYDVDLIPAIAREWSSSRPVLFFEYDHGLSRLAGHDPVAVWDRLAALGYVRVAAWNNAGGAVGHWSIEDLPALAAEALDDPSGDAGERYWDVAVAHGDDAVALAALDQLVPRSV